MSLGAAGNLAPANPLVGVLYPAIGAGGGNMPDFHAFGADANDVIKAVVQAIDSTTTFTRASAAWVDDHEGLIKECVDHEIRHRKGRRIENLANASPEGQGTATVETVDYSASEYRVNGLDATQNQRADWTTVDLTTVLGADRDYRNRIALKGEGSNIGKDVLIIFRRHSGGTSVQSTKTVTLTGEYQTISTDLVTTVTGNIGWRIRLSGNTTNNATSCLLKEGQIEEVTGQANQNPSEYVSVGVGTGSELQADDYATGTGNWTAYGTNTLENDNGSIKVTYVDDANGAFVWLNFDGPGADDGDMNRNPIVNETLAITFEGKASGGTIRYYIGGGPAITIADTSETDWTEFSASFVATSATGMFLRIQNMSAGEIGWMRNISIKRADHGAFVDGVRYYAKTNPCQVDVNGVVTEDVTTTPITDYRTLFEPAATNTVYNSDFTEDGAGGADVFADWIESTAGTSSFSKETSDVPGGALATAAAFNGDGSGSSCQLSPSASSALVTVVAGTDQVVLSFYGKFHQADGAKFSVQSDDGAGGSLQYFDGSAWTSTPTEWTPNDLPTSWSRYSVVLPVTNTGRTRVLLNYIQRNQGFANNTFYVTSVNLVKGSILSTPISTTTTAVTRAADDPTPMFGVENWSQTQGTWYVDVWFSQFNTGGNQSILNLREQNTGPLWEQNGSLKATDDTGTSDTGAQITTADNQYRCVVGFNTGDTLEVGIKDIDGAGSFVWDATPANYSGAFDTPVHIGVARNLGAPIEIRDLKGFTSSKGKTWVEDNL